MENGVATWTQVEGNEAGCVWVDDGWFAPTSSWKGCTDADGTQEIVKSGDIWPLEIGKTESYKVKGQAGTDNWQSTHTCTVKAAVLVTVGEKQRSEEHTSELQYLMRNSQPVFCLKK